MSAEAPLPHAANHGATINHFQSLLRASDARVREREAVINRLKLQLDQERKMRLNKLSTGGGDLGHSGVDSADAILKQSEIDRLTSELEETRTFNARKLKSLSLELGRVEASARTEHTSFEAERKQYKSQIAKLKQQLDTGKNLEDTQSEDLQFLQNKNKKLILRLETVQKYMELLPTREEHMSLEREKTELKLKLGKYEIQNSDIENRVQLLSAELINRDEKLGQLSDAAQQLRERLSQTTELLERERHSKSELSHSLNSEERQKFNRFKEENTRLRVEMERALKLQSAISDNLTRDRKEIEEREHNVKVDLAKERAVAETLRQALIDQQNAIQSLEATIKNKDDQIRTRDRAITELELDLADAKDVLKTADTMKEVSAVLDDVSRDITTIIQIIDRQILDRSNDGAEGQDIMDVSRLLACSLDTNRALGVAKHENTLDSKKMMLCTANDQLTAALALREEIDKLRLKLSDRWTEHLTSDCKVM